MSCLACDFDQVSFSLWVSVFTEVNKNDHAEQREQIISIFQKAVLRIKLSRVLTSPLQIGLPQGEGVESALQLSIRPLPVLPSGSWNDGSHMWESLLFVQQSWSRGAGLQSRYCWVNCDALGSLGFFNGKMGITIPPLFPPRKSWATDLLKDQLALYTSSYQWRAYSDSLPKMAKVLA